MIPATCERCRVALFQFHKLEMGNIKKMLPGHGAVWDRECPARIISYGPYRTFPFRLSLSFHIFICRVFTTIFALAVTGLIRRKPEKQLGLSGP